MSNNLGSSYSAEADQTVVIRRAGDADGSTVTRLAQLDTAPALSGATLIAERDGRAVAAAEIDSGRLVADPFLPTADIVALLTSRARSLRDSGPRSPHPLARRRFSALTS